MHRSVARCADHREGRTHPFWSTTGRPSLLSGWPPVLSTEHTVRRLENQPGGERVSRRRRQLRSSDRPRSALDNFDGLRLWQPGPLGWKRHPAGAYSGHCRMPTITARLLRGLEIGVNDYLVRPVDKNELLARARTQIRKRRLQTNRPSAATTCRIPIEMAITDALTGLHNRRYMESHLGTLAEAGLEPRAKPLALMMLDIDFFKSINDNLRPRRRRRRAARIRSAPAQVDPRHRSGLPLRRRGICHCDAGDGFTRRRLWSRKRLRRSDRRRALRPSTKGTRTAIEVHDLDRAVDPGAQGAKPSATWPQARRHPRSNRATARLAANRVLAQAA